MNLRQGVGRMHDKTSYDVDWNDIFQTTLDASFFMTNVTDKVYRVGQYNDLVANGYITSFYGEPRMWGVQLRYRFGKTL